MCIMCGSRGTASTVILELYYYLNTMISYCIRNTTPSDASKLL